MAHAPPPLLAARRILASSPCSVLLVLPTLFQSLLRTGGCPFTGSTSSSCCSGTGATYRALPCPAPIFLRHHARADAAPLLRLPLHIQSLALLLVLLHPSRLIQGLKISLILVLYHPCRRNCGLPYQPLRIPLWLTFPTIPTLRLLRAQPSSTSVLLSSLNVRIFKTSYEVAD